MKIFSLQSKTGLAAWSVVLGFLIDVVASLLTLNSYQPDCFLGPCPKIYDFGFPFKNHELFLGDLSVLFLNLFFWILISFIILLVIRRFRKKNYQITTKRS